MWPVNRARLMKYLRFLLSYITRIGSGISIIATIVDSHIDNKVKIQRGCNIRYSRIGKYSYVGAKTEIVYSTIGKFCSIARNCSIGGPAHKLDSVSTSPLFTSGRNIFKKNFATIKFISEKETIIENDVWIGTRAVILQGRKIGTGAVIGAGAVVTKDVPPYAIVAGNPARILRYRFEESIIHRLIESEWWEMDEAELEIFGKIFDKPREFLMEIERQ